jgi:hypothetical protein
MREQMALLTLLRRVVQRHIHLTGAAALSLKTVQGFQPVPIPVSLQTITDVLLQFPPLLRSQLPWVEVVLLPTLVVSLAQMVQLT